MYISVLNVLFLFKAVRASILPLAFVSREDEEREKERERAREREARERNGNR